MNRDESFEIGNESFHQSLEIRLKFYSVSGSMWHLGEEAFIGHSKRADESILLWIFGFRVSLLHRHGVKSSSLDLSLGGSIAVDFIGKHCPLAWGYMLKSPSIVNVCRSDGDLGDDSLMSTGGDVAIVSKPNIILTLYPEPSIRV